MDKALLAFGVWEQSSQTTRLLIGTACKHRHERDIVIEFFLDRHIPFVYSLSMLNSVIYS